MDKLTSIKTFQAVVKHKSFSGAAADLGISAQLASKYVAALESELGIRLLNRTTRRVNLTAEGTLYYEESIKILEELEALDSKLAQLKLHASGLLRVSAPVSLGNTTLGGLCGKFLDQYPDMSVDIQLNDRTVDIIEEGFDVALRIGNLVDSSLIARKLAPVTLLVCASESYLSQRGKPSNQHDLTHHHLLKYTYLKNTSGFESRAYPLTSNSAELLVAAAEMGVGVVLAPQYILEESIKAGRLTRLFVYQEEQPPALYAVYPHRQLIPLKIKVFVDYLAHFLKDKTL